MKLANVTLGLAVGIATGVSLVLMERQNQSLGAKARVGTSSDISDDLDIIKAQMNQIKDHALTIKEDSTDFAQSIGGDLKTTLGEFKADITPNIKRLQGYRKENIQNRGNEITNFPTKSKIMIYKLKIFGIFSE
ncbi:YtxH domain-containing protein [Staphylococcus muscae]|uniref:YtxH domain-containing protein n=1 Tax=Staphylococcus muscae TaxID=1294 RepID=UPI001B7FFFD3|nr:YtxH domain-containing protein [Staphylococcus muscae]